MEVLTLHVPGLDELWYRQRLLSDPATMSYNAQWDLDYDGYHRQTGCIDFPREAWADWYAQWIGREPERFYAYVRREPDGEWLGEVCFHHTPEKAWWDMGIVLQAAHRGRGYAAPALRLLAEKAFACGVTRLHNDFEVVRNEIPAWAAHLSAGFQDAGTANGVRHMLLTREGFERGTSQS